MKSWGLSDLFLFKVNDSFSAGWLCYSKCRKCSCTYCTLQLLLLCPSFEDGKLAKPHEYTCIVYAISRFGLVMLFLSCHVSHDRIYVTIIVVGFSFSCFFFVKFWLDCLGPEFHLGKSSPLLTSFQPTIANVCFQITKVPNLEQCD